MVSCLFLFLLPDSLPAHLLEGRDPQPVDQRLSAA